MVKYCGLYQKENKTCSNTIHIFHGSLPNHKNHNVFTSSTDCRVLCLVSPFLLPVTVVVCVIRTCLSQSDFVEFSAALEECGADLRSLTYLKKWK